jgi:hypothetical protein
MSGLSINRRRLAIEKSPNNPLFSSAGYPQRYPQDLWRNGKMAGLCGKSAVLAGAEVVGRRKLMGIECEKNWI